MKFEKFSKIRQSLLIEGAINESTKSYQEYSQSFYQAYLEAEYPEYYASNKPFEGLDVDLLGIASLEDVSVNEKEGGSNILKNIVGFMRIKGLAGKYQKSMVDEAIAEMDYARRKKAAGAGAETKDNAEQLKQAHVAKKESLKDRTKAIGEKIDNIATTEFLKKVATRTKLAARIKKNEIVLKIASKEEAKELKIKNGELSQDLQRIDGELRDYEKDNADNIEAAKKEAAEQFKEKIGELTDNIKEIRKQITDAESEISGNENESMKFEAEEDEEELDFNWDDEEDLGSDDEETGTEEGEQDSIEKKKSRVKAYQEIAPLKQKAGEFYEERAMAKQSYNEAMGEEEYDPEEDQESAQNAYRDAEEYQQKAEDLEEEIAQEEEAAGKDPEEEEGGSPEEEEGGSPEEETDLSDKQKEKISKAEAGLKKAEETGDEDKIKRYKALIDQIKSGKTYGGESEEHNQFWAAIDEELNALEKSFGAKIMKFSDFRNRPR